MKTAFKFVFFALFFTIGLDCIYMYLQPTGTLDMGVFSVVYFVLSYLVKPYGND